MRGRRRSGTSANRRQKAVATNRRAGGPRRDPQSVDAILADLKHWLSEIYDLNAAGSLLGWDEATYMPVGGAAARGRQSALLQRLAHERFVAPALGKQIE